MTITINPMLTTNAGGNFNVQSNGLVQGTAWDAPNSRYNLAQGTIAASQTSAIYGGMAIQESIPASPGNSLLAGQIIVASGLANATGISVFDQAYAAINAPGAPVPLLSAGQTCNFYRFGSGQRIAVAMSPVLVDLYGDIITTQVSWDFVNQLLIPYQPSYNSASVASATYNSTTGILALTFGSAPAGTSPTVGANFSVSGLAGTGAVASLNGDWALASSASSGTVLNLQAPTGLGSISITSSTGTLAAGGGAFPVKILEIDPSNSMTVAFNASGQAIWNLNGACALVLI